MFAAALQVITTRTYDDRLKTIDNVRKAGISVCCGGILGLGEEKQDRIALLHTLATMEEHPESVPVNALGMCCCLLDRWLPLNGANL